jgi:hypothetical protein
LPRIRNALKETINARDEFAQACMQQDEIFYRTIIHPLTPECLIQDIKSVLDDDAMAGKGLAEALAEQGKFPIRYADPNTTSADKAGEYGRT